MSVSRYCGELKLNINLAEDSIHYSVNICRNGERIARVAGLRRSPHDESTMSADCPEAYDRVARAALSFGSFEHGDNVSSFAELDDEADWIVRRHK